MTPPLRLCKNGCKKPAYRKRFICLDCIKEENRKRYRENKQYYNKRKRKPKHKVKCGYCHIEFETAKPNQMFCCEAHYQKHYYENKPLHQKTRARAMERIYDKGKTKTTGVQYTKAEINFIIKNYGKLNAIEIAAKLDRPVKGVRWKIRELKEELKIIPKDIF